MKTKSIIWMALLVILIQAASTLYANGFHPEFPLLDQQGQSVINSGMPFSTLKTCGSCHDTDYIEIHSDHSDAGAKHLGASGALHQWDAGPGYFGAWNAIDYDLIIKSDGTELNLQAWLKRYGSRHVGGGPVADLVEMDCLLCHSNITDNQLRNKALKTGDFSWANSAPLATLGILKNKEGKWLWNAEKFTVNGNLTKGLLLISKPLDENCAQCHGLVSNDLSKPLILEENLLDYGMTARTGQIISPQKISLSGLNVKAKDSLTLPFDVHSDRILGCVNCHYSLNNPVYFQRTDEEQPEHLIFDPRRLTSADYLQRPLHQFAKGNSSHGLASESENTLRRCESCHEAENVHQWLPYKASHFEALACESCHIPKLYGPTLKTIDWSMLNTDGKPLMQYRNSGNDVSKSSNMLTAFEPILLPRENVGGTKKLAPFNLITSWYWTAGEAAQPISTEYLKRAFFVPEKEPLIYQAGLIAALDKDKDNLLSIIELRLDSADKVAAVKAALEHSGLTNVSLSGDVAAYAISHNVVNGKWATKDCQSCHHKNSKVDGVIGLSNYTPGGITPLLTAHQGMEFSGSIEKVDGGQLEFHADASQSGFYILGLDSVPLMDLIGRIMFFSVLLGVTLHATARRIASRRRREAIHRNYRKEYIYNPYERLWHWFQAISVLILMATGSIINLPHFYDMFSFAYSVQVHNIVGFILATNAVLAIFYNLTSGEIKQYLPNPKGFVKRAVAQAIFYSKGIFRGQAHPHEKRRENRLNPIQQVTYLAILYVLLPTQIITGILMWGLQRWPELTGELGGLAFLAPIHALAAWAFGAFLVMHIYLTTTGHTHSAGIKSMITGWDDVHVADAPKQQPNNK